VRLSPDREAALGPRPSLSREVNLYCGSVMSLVRKGEQLCTPLRISLTKKEGSKKYSRLEGGEGSRQEREK